MFIGICDDSSLDRDIIADFLSNYFSEKGIEYRINIYENGSNLIYDIQDGALPDIIFLDIYLENGEMGIEVARKLRQNNYCGSIVFLTASADFAIDSYDVEASGYLLKPHSYEKLCGVMDRIVKNITVDFKSYNISVRGALFVFLAKILHILKAIIQSALYIQARTRSILCTNALAK